MFSCVNEKLNFLIKGLSKRREELKLTRFLMKIIKELQILEGFRSIRKYNLTIIFSF